MSISKMVVVAGGMALSAGAANAAVYYATSVESYTPGVCTRPAECVASRYNPANALGAPNGTFVSLGMEGQLTLGFGTSITASESEVTA